MFSVFIEKVSGRRLIFCSKVLNGYSKALNGGLKALNGHSKVLNEKFFPYRILFPAYFDGFLCLLPPISVRMVIS